MPVSPSAVDICDYQCNAAFALAKQRNSTADKLSAVEKTTPMDVAREIAAKFKSSVATAEAAAPGFVNFRVTDAELLKQAQGILQSGNLPIEKRDFGRTIFFDYGGANIAKELHVGHLRSPIIGEAMKRVFQALGAKTVSDTFLGDWGLQIGLVIAEWELHNKLPSKVEGGTACGGVSDLITLENLNYLYPRASARSKTDPAFKARAEEITLKMQQQQQPYFDIWKKIRDVSVAKIRENYGTLNCTFDTFNGESHAQKYVPEVLETLKKAGAYISDNCLIMDVKEDTDTGPMPPILLQKSNGGELYSTTDAATIFYRFRDHAPNEFIYFIDARQELHMKQVFRCAQIGGLVAPGTRLMHVSYGTMNGSDGKPFKTRAGGTIKFEEVIDMVTEAAAKRLAENGKATDADLAQKIGIAALKFADLSNHVRKDYIFDIEKFTNFEGKTGPYILYTIARINSLFKKAFKHPVTPSARHSVTVPMLLETSSPDSHLRVELFGTARAVIIKTLKLADCYPAAAANYTLNGIVDAAFALAAEFNLFYANTKILTEPDADKRSGYLEICQIVKIALEFAMNTLAIDVVEEM